MRALAALRIQADRHALQSPLIDSHTIITVSGSDKTPRKALGEGVSNEQNVARREKVNHFAGAGCLIQGAGLLAPLILGAIGGLLGFVVGIPVALVLLLAGSRKSVTWRCGHCKNPVADPDVRMCPVCRATLE